MKTFIIVRNADKAVINVGMIYKESGGFTDGIAALVKEHGEDAGIMVHANQICPPDGAARLVDTADLPGGDGGLNFDKLFYGVNGEDENGVAFEHRGWTDANPGTQVDIEMNEAKEIAHLYRRAKREKDFEPHDEIIAKQIPGKDATAAEAARQVIRDNDAALQVDIDSAADEAALRLTLSNAGII